MRIIKGADQASEKWTVRKFLEKLEADEINLDVDIQRGFVWKKDRERCSLLIRSLILERFVPPLYFNKVGSVYECLDGKQRSDTIKSFFDDEFELCGLDEFEVINDDGASEIIDINGCIYSELPECFQDAFRDATLTICFTDNATPEEQADTFFNLNNGKPLNKATQNRVKAKSRDVISRLGKHSLWQDALTTTSIKNHANEDLSIKAHAMLYAENPSTEATWIGNYMRSTKITPEQENELLQVFDRIQELHTEITDNRIARRAYVRTHMISIVPIVLRSIKEHRTITEFTEWFESFYCGKRPATNNAIYNKAASNGSGKKESVRKRVLEIEKSYNAHFKDDTHTDVGEMPEEIDDEVRAVDNANNEVA